MNARSPKKEIRPAFLPHPPAGRKPKSRRISKALVSVLRILPPAKLLLKTESAFVFSVFPHFCFCRSSVLRTEALQRAGNASILYHQDCFQNKFEFCIIDTATNIVSFDDPFSYVLSATRKPTCCRKKSDNCRSFFFSI